MFTGSFYSYFFVGLVLLALVVLFYLRRNKQSLFTRLLRKKALAEAEAVILGIQLTGLYIKEIPQAIFQIQVTPERGKNFVVEIKGALPVSDFPKVQAGEKIRVRYNPYRRKEMYIVKKLQSSQKPAGNPLVQQQ
ncbi:MAG TPA: hypothetical protein PLC48_00795 [Ferruginibacter sp.]|nr:hypothetical protein [Ferruginibacter sp.]